MEMATREHVFLLEDDIGLQQALVAIFEEKGYRVSTYESAESLLVSLYKEVPSVLVADVNLAGINAIELMEFLKSNQSFQTIPVIMMTADMNQERKLKALHVGALDFMLKPFAAEELLLKIKNLLRWKKKIAEELKSPEGVETSRFYNEQDKLKNRIKEYLSTKKGADLMNYDKMAGFLNMSRSSFQKKVRSHFQNTVSELVNELKVEISKNYLLHTNLNIGEIASICGFNSHVYFHNVFKKIMGMSPKDFRQENSEKSDKT